MRNIVAKGKGLIITLFVNCLFVGFAVAEEVAAGVATGGSEIISAKAAAALAMGIAVAGATNAQGKAIASTVDSIGRNPGAAGAMFVPWVLALALIESLAIFMFVVFIMAK